MKVREIESRIHVGCEASLYYHFGNLIANDTLWNDV